MTVPAQAPGTNAKSALLPHLLSWTSFFRLPALLSLSLGIHYLISDRQRGDLFVLALFISLRRACHPFASVTSSLLRSSSVASSRGNCSNNHTNSLRKHKQPLLLSKVRLGHFSQYYLLAFSCPSLIQASTPVRELHSQSRATDQTSYKTTSQVAPRCFILPSIDLSYSYRPHRLLWLHSC